MFDKFMCHLSDKTIDRIGNAIVFLVFVAIVIFMYALGFYLHKIAFDFFFSSDAPTSDVVNSVCEMIKPEMHKEILIDPTICKK